MDEIIVNDDPNTRKETILYVHQSHPKAGNMTLCGMPWHSVPSIRPNVNIEACMECMSIENSDEKKSNNDPDNWKKEAQGPYVPKGFRHQEVAAKMIQDGIKEMSVNRNDTETEFQVDISNGMTKIKIGEDEYVFNGLMYINDKKWSIEEIARFHNALDSRRQGMVSMEELRNIAANPDLFTSLGRPIPGVDMSNQIEVIYGHENIKKKLDEVKAQGYEVGSYAGLENAKYIVVDRSKLVKTKNTEDVMKEMTDAINHPSHYTQYKDVEVIDVTEELNFNRGNAVKYIARAGFKNKETEIQDLEKALWYVERELVRDNSESSLGDMERVERLVEQMNFHRGNSVWMIALAGRTGRFVSVDLKESTFSIKAEIKRVKNLEK